MLVVFEHVRRGLTAKQIIQPIVSLGMPSHVHKGSDGTTWAITMNSMEQAKDAVWVLQRHLLRIHQFYGPSVGVAFANALPSTIAFVSKSVTGRAEQ